MLNKFKRLMLTRYRNEDLAEMLEDVEAGINPAALLRTVMEAIIELREAAHYTTTVPPTDCSEEGDSEVKKEEQEKEEGPGGKAVVEGGREAAVQGGGRWQSRGGREVTMWGEEIVAGLTAVKEFLSTCNVDRAE